MDVAPKSRDEKDFERLGFRHDFAFPVAGVTFEGRQAALQAVSGLYYTGVRLWNVDGGLFLSPEPDNEYDENAVGVHAASAFGPKPGAWLHIGYVPKRWCPGCESALTAKQVAAEKCPACDTVLDDPRSYLNKYIIERYVEGKVPVFTGLLWIGQNRGTWGARVAVGEDDG